MSRYHWWITSILIVSAVLAGRPRSSFLKSTIPAPTPTSPTPSTTPAPGANWSTVWSTNLQAQCARTDFGVLCNNVPWWLGLIHPKSGETLWNITAPTFDNINGTQLYFPVSLTKEIIYIAGYGINIKTGKVLWQEQATSGCTNGLFVVADGPSNFVVTCTRQTLDLTLFLDTFSIFVSNGTALFHISKNVTNVSYQGAVAVSHHAIVCQYGLDFYAVDSQSGKQLWTYTPSLLNADMFPISAPAADAFVLTYGNNVTALAYEDGSVLWSQSNFLNLEYGCQSIAYVNDPQTKNASREVIVWVGWNGTLIFTESRTGTTAFQTTVWTSDTTIACAFAVNDAYVWTSSGSNFTAISLTTLEVEWTTLVPLPYSFDIIHVGSPTNRDPYVRHLEGNLIRLHDGGIQHKFLVPLQVEGVQVAQYDDDGVVVLNTDAGLVAYKLPR